MINIIGVQKSILVYNIDNNCKPFIAGQIAELKQGNITLSDGTSPFGIFATDYVKGGMCDVLYKDCIIETDMFDSTLAYSPGNILYCDSSGMFTTTITNLRLSIGSILDIVNINGTAMLLKLQFCKPHNNIIEKKSIGGNCTKCYLFNEYQECDYICYSCKIWSGE